MLSRLSRSVVASFSVSLIAVLGAGASAHASSVSVLTGVGSPGWTVEYLPYGGAFPAGNPTANTPTLSDFTSSPSTALIYSGTGGNPTQNAAWFNPSGTGASWIGASSTLGLSGPEQNTSSAVNNAAGFYLFQQSYSIAPNTSADFLADFASDNKVDSVYANGSAITFSQSGGPEFTYRAQTGAISGVEIDGNTIITLSFIVENVYYYANGGIANPNANPTGLVVDGSLTPLGAGGSPVPLPPAAYGGIALLSGLGFSRALARKR